MKPDIHPAYYEKVTVTCSCGNTFETGSTTKSIQVEICAACHPFFTGKAKLVDTAGRVDRFKERLARAQEHQAAQAQKTKKPRRPQSEPDVVTGAPSNA